jgi:hypothetical protein
MTLQEEVQMVTGTSRTLRVLNVDDEVVIQFGPTSLLNTDLHFSKAADPVLLEKLLRRFHRIVMPCAETP